MLDRERIPSRLPFRNREPDGGLQLPSLDPAKLFEKYKQICYTLGRHLDKNPNEDIARMIYQADLEMTPGLFLSLLLVTAALCAAVMFVVSLIIFLAPFSPFASESPLLYIFALTFFAPIVVAVGFPFYLTSQISNKKIDIEKNLPYALAFMSILASSGATPLDIIRRIAHEDYGHISREFGKVIFRVEILGEDAVTAMNSMVNSTPSELFRDTCMDLANLIYGGSGLAGYLASKSKELMEIAARTGAHLMVGHILLFHPAIRKIKEVLKSGKIGDLHYVYSTRLNLGTVRTEENVFWSFAPHDISVLDFLIEKPAISIEAKGAKFLQDKIFDVTMTQFEYPGNIHAHIFVSWLHPFKEQRLVLVGSKGMLSFDDSSKEKEILFYNKRIDIVNGIPVKVEEPDEVIAYEKKAPLAEELTYFVEHFDQPIEIAGGESGYEVVKVLENVQNIISK
jgi:hypothetical protein